MAQTVRRTVYLLALAVICSACRVDVSVDVAMNNDGSGTITVMAVADADIVARAPSLATDLRLEDVRAAGWTVAGPEPTPEGGLQVVLTRAFLTPAQANAMLAGLNGPSGPLVGLTLGRSRGNEATTYTLNGSLQVVGGLDAFSDPDLLAAVGATPYATEIAAAGLQPADVVGVTFTATVPGSITATTAENEAALELGRAPRRHPRRRGDERRAEGLEEPLGGAGVEGGPGRVDRVGDRCCVLHRLRHRRPPPPGRDQVTPLAHSARGASAPVPAPLRRPGGR